MDVELSASVGRDLSLLLETLRVLRLVKDEMEFGSAVS